MDKVHKAHVTFLHFFIVTTCQPTTRQVRTSVNPAYETVMLHYLHNNNTADYEIV